MGRCADTQDDAPIINDARCGVAQGLEPTLVHRPLAPDADAVGSIVPTANILNARCTRYRQQAESPVPMRAGQASTRITFYANEGQHKAAQLWLMAHGS